MKKRMAALILAACMLFGAMQPGVTVQASELEQVSAEGQSADAKQESAEEQATDTKQASVEEQVSELEQVSAEGQSADAKQESAEEQAVDTEQVSVEEQAADTGQVSDMEQPVEESADEPKEEQEGEITPQEMAHPTGLMTPEIIDVGIIESNQPYSRRSRVAENWIGSYIYQNEWDKYSTNYYYNLLTKEQKNLWDQMDAICLRLLLTAEQAQTDTYGSRTAYVSCGSVLVDDANEIMRIFKYSNPQYFFLNHTNRRARDTSGNYYVALGVYTSFTNGSDRQTAMQQMKSKLEEQLVNANQYTTAEEKVKAFHDWVVNKVEYNNDILRPDFNEDIAYTQSAYSVFCMDKTVCAGYSMAFSMLCNAVGVDCIVAISEEHGWNKVRLRDSWYNVDCTWADQASGVYYRYFERSNASYANDSSDKVISHTPLAYWQKYLPSCSLDSNANYANSGTLPVIVNKTATPTISVTRQGTGYQVSLSSKTPNAAIYYTVNGGTPSPAFTKSLKYAQPFTIDKDCVIKAVAVCDTYWDSAMLSVQASSVASVEKQTYRIFFDGNGATSGNATSMTYNAGQSITMPSNVFSRNGYEFTGWNTRADGNGAGYTAGQSVGTGGWSGNVTLFAQWRAGADSANKASFVALLYENVLERNAEDSEIQYWIQELESGRTGSDVAYLFIFSQEFINKGLSDSDYAERLYMSLMGRPSDPGGKSDWLTRLDNGVSREYVLKQFIESAEFTQKCENYGILRGTIALTEMRDQNYDVTRFVARNYKQFLGRDYEVDGLNYWCAMILSRERTMQEIAMGFVFSEECLKKNLSNEEFAEMMYLGCFDRAGEVDGVAYWSRYLDTGAKSREDVFHGFADSTEFDNMVHSYGL
ncbi:MAG: DUF4214 domain-containing protein [Roseburia sp.]